MEPWNTNNYLLQGYDSKASLSSCVNNMVKETRTSEVFDKEIKAREPKIVRVK